MVIIGTIKNKKTTPQHRIKLIAWYEPAYENPRGFSIRFLFAKLRA
jgi:hypothetical protein